MKNIFKKVLNSQQIRFLFVGGLNTIVGYGTYAILIYFNINFYIANAISTIIGVFHSYLWNRYFTFKSKDKALNEIIRFISVYIVSFLLSNIILYIFVSKFGINKYLGGLINLAITTLISWFGHKYFSFRKRV